MDKEAKLQALRELYAEMARHPLPFAGKANLVFGEGNPAAHILFIGEAPGFHEDEMRRPFVGVSGKLLDKMLFGIGLPRAEVYITNIVKRRPPQNRDPLPEEIEAYKPFLAKQIQIIQPKIIATLGRFSMNYFLPEAKISRDHGKKFELDGHTIFPLFHPAAALRAGNVMRDLETDFYKLKSVIAPPEPPKPVVAAKVEELKGPEQVSLF